MLHNVKALCTHMLLPALLVSCVSNAAICERERVCVCVCVCVCVPKAWFKSRDLGHVGKHELEVDDFDITHGVDAAVHVDDVVVFKAPYLCSRPYIRKWMRACMTSTPNVMSRTRVRTRTHTRSLNTSKHT